MMLLLAPSDYESVLLEPLQACLSSNVHLEPFATINTELHALCNASLLDAAGVGFQNFAVYVADA